MQVNVTHGRVRGNPGQGDVSRSNSANNCSRSIPSRGISSGTIRPSRMGQHSFGKSHASSMPLPSGSGKYTAKCVPWLDVPCTGVLVSIRRRTSCAKSHLVGTRNAV